MTTQAEQSACTVPNGLGKKEGERRRGDRIEREREGGREGRGRKGKQIYFINVNA